MKILLSSIWVFPWLETQVFNLDAAMTDVYLLVPVLELSFDLNNFPSSKCISLFSIVI